jgi:hypothetical protein
MNYRHAAALAVLTTTAFAAAQNPAPTPPPVVPPHKASAPKMSLDVRFVTISTSMGRSGAERQEDDRVIGAPSCQMPIFDGSVKSRASHSVTFLNPLSVSTGMGKQSPENHSYDQFIGAAFSQGPIFDGSLRSRTSHKITFLNPLSKEAGKPAAPSQKFNNGKGKHPNHQAKP